LYKLNWPQGTKWVTVTAIEFNWVFNTKHGKEFLWYLAETTNLELFTIPVISNIVRFQWKYFQIALTIFLLIPHMCYFILFNFYATWIYYWSWESPYDNSNTIIRWVCFGFLVYFLLFVSLGRLISSGFRWFFLSSFWNIYDLISIGLNLAIIICDIVEVDFFKTNAICCPAVGLMWIKTFYYLKIFP